MRRFRPRDERRYPFLLRLVSFLRRVQTRRASRDRRRLARLRRNAPLPLRANAETQARSRSQPRDTRLRVQTCRRARARCPTVLKDAKTTRHEKDSTRDESRFRRGRTETRHPQKCPFVVRLRLRLRARRKQRSNARRVYPRGGRLKIRERPTSPRRPKTPRAPPRRLKRNPPPNRSTRPPE